MGQFDLEPLRGNLACTFCAASPFYRWQRRLTAADVAWAVKQQGRGSVWPVQALDVAAYSTTGRVAQMRIRGAGRELLVSGYEFRRLFGFASLRSTAFAIVPGGDGFILQGRGWGHGVGLCQWGAADLARRGLLAHEILALYYPHTELAQLESMVVEPMPVPEGRS